MEIREFLFRKDSRTTTVPFPAKPIHSVKCNCGFDGLASQLIKAYGQIKCPVCNSGSLFTDPIHLANGELWDCQSD